MDPLEPLPDLVSEQPTSLPPWRRTLLLVTGQLCLVLGVIFWLIPVVTGIPFYLAGFALLAPVSPRFARWINALDRKLPHRARLALRRTRMWRKERVSQLAAGAQGGDGLVEHGLEGRGGPAEFGAGARGVEAEVGAEHADGGRGEQFRRGDGVERGDA